MKILTLNHSDTNGGAARAATRIFNSLKTFDVENIMLVKNKFSNDNSVIEASKYNNEGFAKLLEDIIWKVKNRIRKNKWSKYSLQKGVYLSDLGSTNITNALNSIDFDILHLHWINEQFLNINELKRISRPIIWTLHDCWPFTGICHYFYECEKYKLKCGKCPFLKSNSEQDLSRKVWEDKFKVYENCKIQIVAPSQWLGRAANDSNLFKDFNIRVIPNCIDTNIYRPVNKMVIREILGLSIAKKYILFGAFNATNDKNKGFQNIQNALEKLSTGNKGDIELLIIGSHEITKRKLFGFLANFLGYFYDDFSLSALYNAADITVVPSLSENLSNVIMESLACGTPVVAFNIGGNSDMIEHKNNGYLAEAFNAMDLAQGINWCLENNNKQLSEHAREKVLKNYVQERVARMYFDLYNSLLS